MISDKEINDIIGDMTPTTKIENHHSEDLALMGTLGEMIWGYVVELDHDDRVRFIQEKLSFLLDYDPDSLGAPDWLTDALKDAQWK